MFKKAKITTAILTIFIFGFTTVSFGDGATFHGMGFLPGGYPASNAYGVSADGSTVVGYGSSPDTALRWQNGQLMALGSTATGNYANAVSANGSVIVGERNYGSEAVRWENGQETGLGGLPESGNNSHAFGVSADGSVVVGYSFSNIGAEAFRWGNGTMAGLGYLHSQDTSSSAWGISADGSVIVGSSSSSAVTEAFRWKNGQMTGLGDLPGGSFYSDAIAVSTDGSTVVGYSDSTLGLEAFRWTETGSMEGLGYVGDISYAHHVTLAVSADGSIIVGTSSDEAYIWDEQHGKRDLKDVLQNEYGLNLNGWLLGAATGISADGKTIVGMGADPSGNTEGWIATVPEPATILLLGLGGLFLRRSHS